MIQQQEPLFLDEEDVEWDENEDPIPSPATLADLKRDLNVKANTKVLNEIEKLVPPSRSNGEYSQNSTVMDINYAFLQNQARYFCVYSEGPLGIGKTSYALQCLMQLYGTYDYDGRLVELCKDWEKIACHIVFHPQTFKQIIQHLQKTKTRIKGLVWDDSGIFLAAKDWQKAWAKEIVKYFQLARTYCSSIILTTPSPSLILKDIRRLNMVTLNVKFVRSKNSFNHSRRALGYDHWYLPDLTKPRMKFRGSDEFNVMLPDCIYRPYQDMRAGYADYELEKVFELIGDDGKDMIEDLNLERLAESRF